MHNFKDYRFDSNHFRDFQKKVCLRLKFLFACLILFFLCSCNHYEKLPIYGDRSPVMKTINGKTEVDTIFKTIPSFRYLNQNGSYFSNKNLVHKIYIADFFFISCPTICPIMQKNMSKLADQFKSDSDINFISFTIDPKHDSVARLKKYEKQIGATGKHWYFLNGNRDSTYQLAEKGFFATAKADSTAPGGFVHSGGLILVDKLGRIRGIYDGTLEDEMKKLSSDINILKEENN